MPDNESKDIAQRALTSLAALGLGAAAEAVAGGGSVAIEALTTAAKHAWDYRQERARDRLRELHLHLLSPLTSEEREVLLGQEFSKDDYYVVLESAVADEERDKCEYYAKLLRALIQEDFEGRMRSHLLRSFRALTIADFGLIAKICEATLSEARAPDVNSPDRRIEYLLQKSDALVMASVENLVFWGYLRHGERARIPWPTQLTKTLARVADFSVPRL